MKFRNIGDVLLTTPMASALAELPEKPEVTFLVKKGTEEMLTGHPDIHEVLILPTRDKKESKLAFAKRQWRFAKKLRATKFDISINTTEGDRGIIMGLLAGAKKRIGYLKPSEKWWRRYMITHPREWKRERRHTVLRNLDLINDIVVPKKISVGFHFSDNDQQYVKQLLQRKGWNETQKLVHIHPVSRWFFKCWRDDYMADTIDAIQTTMNAKVVVTCAPDKKERDKLDDILQRCQTEPIDLGGQLTLKQTGALSALATLFFGVDSAPMHMAAAVNTKTIALFGPSGGFEWGPWENSWASMDTPYIMINGIQQTAHTVIQQNWECVPCGQDGCNGSKRSECLKHLETETVRTLIKKKLY